MKDRTIIGIDSETKYYLNLALSRMLKDKPGEKRPTLNKVVKLCLRRYVEDG